MSPLSMDLRQRIIDAVIEGSQSMPRIAERFGVSYNMVQKLKYQWRDLGTIEPQTQNVGRKPVLSESQRKKLDKLVRDNPSLTLEQLRSKIRANCCVTTIWNELRRLGHTHKKSSCMPVSSNAPT